MQNKKKERKIKFIRVNKIVLGESVSQIKIMIWKDFYWSCCKAEKKTDSDWCFLFGTTAYQFIGDFRVGFCEVPEKILKEIKYKPNRGDKDVSRR